MTEFEEEGARLADPKDEELAVKRNPNKEEESYVEGKPLVDPISNTQGLETKIEYDIMAFGVPEVVERYREIVNRYSLIWQDTGRTVNIPESDWITIPLKKGWKEAGAKLAHQVYAQGPKDKQVINKEHNKLHLENRMSWENKLTPFGFSTFVVWKTVFTGPKKIPERKSRVVVDVRPLNKWAEVDAYSLPLQSDITSAVQGCQFIFTVNGTGFFHQWNVARKNRHKLSVVSHRGLEQYNVALMEYKNSPAYVQRKMDNLLRDLRSFVRTFIDNIVIFSKTFKDHLVHLDKVFSRLEDLHITLKSSKSYLGYPSITLLGQKVDGLGLSTSEEKIAALANLSFPTDLKILEYYIGLTNWMRNFMPYYAQISGPLQDLKTELLKRAPVRGQARKKYAEVTKVEQSKDALASFKAIQDYYKNCLRFVHFDPDRTLYIDVDASKQRGFGVTVYHVRGEPGAVFSKNDIEPIMFLSKMLNNSEKDYWSTELEVACLVWTIKKTRHMVESAKRTIVFTDHSATTDIAKQTSMASTSTNRLNLKLVRASQYLSQFELDIVHKPGRENVVPDALFRLAADFNETDLAESGALEEIYAYNLTLIEMSPDFRDRLKTGYEQNKKWRKVIEVIDAKRTDKKDNPEEEVTQNPELATDPQHSQNSPEEDETDPEPVRGINFRMRRSLIYQVDVHGGKERLCIPKSLEKEIFHLAHDQRSYQGFYRTYNHVAEGLYFRKLFRRLKNISIAVRHAQWRKPRDIRHMDY